MKRRLHTKASKLYDHVKDKINLLEREDIHLHFANHADELIEESDIHVQDPFVFSLESIFNWSADNTENFDMVIEYYRAYIESTIDNIRSKEFMYSEFSSRGFDHYENEINEIPNNIDRIHYGLRIDKERLKHIYATADNSFEYIDEIHHIKENIFNAKMHLSNYTFKVSPVTKLYSNAFALTNECTITNNIGESDNSYYKYNFRTRSIGEIIELISDVSRKGIDKGEREIIFPTTGNNRPSGDAYHRWNGFQAFDLDIKIEKEYGDRAEEIKQIIHKHLSQYNWYLCSQLSSSGRAIHVFTKVSRMHHLYKDVEHNEAICRYWYKMNYIHKYAIIRYLLINKCGIESKYIDRAKESIFDNSLARVQQGIALSYDPNVLVNENFIDMYPVIHFHKAPVKGIDIGDWLTDENITKTFSYDLVEFKKIQNGIIKHSSGDINYIKGDLPENLKDIKTIGIQNMPSGERYKTRYRVCNTMIAQYGDSDDVRDIIHHILETYETDSVREVNAFITSAVTKKKHDDHDTAIKLKQLGIDISVNKEDKDKIEVSNVNTVKVMLDILDFPLKRKLPDTTISLDSDKYLNHIKDSILNSLKKDKVNLLESAPGTGKTELMKSLAKECNVCLVVPFTPIIESKIAYDEEICEYFDLYYGKYSIKDMKVGRSAVMTFDKFSQLKADMYKMFKYIIIDESHLLHTSNYRLEVTSRATETVRNYVSDELKRDSDAFSVFDTFTDIDAGQPTIIYMTGTITGEVDYYNNYDMLNYIKVNRIHPYKKNANIILCRSNEDKNFHIACEIANCITNNKKVIHPTNAGDKYTTAIASKVSMILGRSVKYIYYKRDNINDNEIKDINDSSTTGDLELLFCTDFLSVGVDIHDSERFKIMYDDTFTAQEIDQFNNRLRRADINCNIYTSVLNNEGQVKSDLFSTKDVEYNYSTELENIIKDDETASQLSRNFRNNDKFCLTLGKINSRYFYLDSFGNIKYRKAAFELDVFEKMFKRIASRLLYVKTALTKYFGYNVYTHEATPLDVSLAEALDATGKEAIEELKIERSKAYIDAVLFLSKEENKESIKNKDVEYKESNKKGLSLEISELTLDPILNYDRDYRTVIHTAKSHAMFLRKYYSHESVCSILSSHTKKNGDFDFTEYLREIELQKIIVNETRSSLSTYTKNTLDIVYKYINSKEQVTIDILEYDKMFSDIRNTMYLSIKKISGNTILSEQKQDSIEKIIENLLVVILKKRKKKDMYIVSLRKIRPFDESKMLERVMYDNILYKLFDGKKYIEQQNDNENVNVQDMHIDSTKIENFDG